MYDFDQRKISGELITERDKEVYRIIEEFCSAKRNFPKGLQWKMQLKTMKLRREAYLLFHAFEAIKELNQ